jgi:hypothetical protein
VPRDRREPTIDELAEATGIDPDHARQALEAADASTSTEQAHWRQRDGALPASPVSPAQPELVAAVT